MLTHQRVAKLETVLNVGATRRDFLRMAAGTTALGLTACAAGVTSPKPEGSFVTAPKPEGSFDPVAFDKWYRSSKLYNGTNPNLRSPHGPARTGYTFRDSMTKWFTPGVGYSMPSNEIMVAVAPGIIKEYDFIPLTGRAGGKYVTMQHPAPLSFASNFSHIEELLCDPKKPFVRGQPICRVPGQYADIAKLLFWDLANLSDPDNYGENHSYMKYPPKEPQPEEVPTVAQNKEKQNAQIKIVERIDKARRHADRDRLEDKLHNKGGYKETPWSFIEKLRYLAASYEMFPDEFQGLPPEEFQVLRTRFFELQPIVLTLPFRKG